MRQRLEHWLNPIWWGHAKPPAWLQALVPIYRLGFLLARKFNSAQQPPGLQDRAIVVVGNIAVGGSGKTPLVVRLCHILLAAGLRPAVVSRGYGRKHHGLLRVTMDATAEEVGDEPLLIARRTGVPVVVAADRCAAAQVLFDSGIDVVIADDGLQHHRLPRSLEICVVDGQRDFGNGYLLPAGPLREPLQRLSEVDYMVINDGEDSAADTAGAIPMQLVPGLLYALDGDTSWRLSQFAGCRVSAVAGIGNPQRFFRCLQQAGLHVSEYAFADHHVYGSEDFAAMEPELPIIMTEKDAVKCHDLKLANAWYLSVDASLPSAWESELVAKLQSSLQRQRNS
jgi:tetraacyldisaccharide 4'-kinase